MLLIRFDRGWNLVNGFAGSNMNYYFFSNIWYATLSPNCLSNVINAHITGVGVFGDLIGRHDNGNPDIGEVQQFGGVQF